MILLIRRQDVKRSTILDIWLVMLIASFLGIVVIGLSPAWMLVLMIKPGLIQPLSDLAMTRVTRVALRQMVSGGKK